MINTMSAFYYGHTVTEDNIYINFIDGGVEKLATLNVGVYSLEEFAIEVARAMTEVGEQEYAVTVDRLTRKLTISASDPFELNFLNGTSGSNPYPLMGFDRVDLFGTNSYEGQNPSGYSYRPQFMLQGYIDFAHSQRASSASVNKSASGKSFEVISFGKEQTMKCEIMFATNIDQGAGGPIETNLTGVQDLQAFMEYITTKATIEFVPDRDAPDTFHKCILLSTPDSKDGVGFEISDMYSRGAVGYHETGKLTFIKVT